jgi:hypothetical protein
VRIGLMSVMDGSDPSSSRRRRSSASRT